MAPRIPTLDQGKIPTVPAAARGTIYENVGKYARGTVLYAFEAIGGADRLSEWAESNPDDFYTKLFPKIITKEVDVNEGQRGVADLLDALDGDYEVVESEPAAADSTAEGSPGARGPASYEDPGGNLSIEDAEILEAGTPKLQFHNDTPQFQPVDDEVATLIGEDTLEYEDV